MHICAYTPRMAGPKNVYLNDDAEHHLLTLQKAWGLKTQAETVRQALAEAVERIPKPTKRTRKEP